MAVVTKTLRATGTNTSLVRASNVVTVTLTTASTPNVKAGDTIVISGSTATTDSFNGTFTVASVTSTTVFTYAQTGADETATAAGYIEQTISNHTPMIKLTQEAVKHITDNFKIEKGLKSNETS